MATRLSTPIRGIIPPLITPLNANGSLDERSLERLVESMIAAGVNGIFPLGTTGEAPHLGRDLRAAFLRLAASIANRRVPVFAGITDSSVDEAAWMAERAFDAGCDAVVFAAPHYYPMTQAELTGFIRALAARLPLSFLLYNIPFCTRDSFSIETIRRASELPGCLGVKDSTGDMDLFQRLIEAFRDRPEFTILIGPEEQLWEAVRMGAHGGVTGGANLAPDIYTSLYAAAVANRFDLAAPLIAKVNTISERIYDALPERSGYFRGLKCAMELRGLCQEYFAPPFEPVPHEARERIRAALIDAGLL